MLWYGANRTMKVGILAAMAGAGTIGGVANAQPCVTPEWIELTTTNSPPARWNSAMAYDAKRDRIVIYGGTGFGATTPVLSDTWEFDGTDWIQRTPFGPTPGGRSGHTMVYDTVREVTLLQSAGQTWTWNGVSWIQVSANGPITQDAMAFDSDRGVAVLYDGQGRTWEWDGETWSPRTPAAPPVTDPGGLFWTAMCYDIAREQTLLVGGSEQKVPESNHTWSWDGTAWTELFPETLLRPRREHVMAYDPVREVAVVFGGHQNRFANPLGDTWEYDGTTWREIDIPGPSPRGFACMAFDSARNRMVLIGADFAILRDTWIYRVGDAGELEFTTQPQDVTVHFHGQAMLTAAVSGGGPVTFQWRLDGEPITNGGGTTGATTDTLTIANALAKDAGTYDVVVTSECETITSDPAVVMVTTCPAEFNGDGVFNSQDFFDFMNAFFVQDPAADINESGTVDSNDFFEYVVFFFAGCGK